MLCAWSVRVVETGRWRRCWALAARMVEGRRRWVLAVRVVETAGAGAVRAGARCWCVLLTVM